MLGLGNSITSRYIESSNWPGATKFLSFDGVNDKAQLPLNESIRTQLSGTNDSTDDIQDNITISMWVKPTWTFDEDGANFIGFFALGSDSDLHENIRLYHHLELGSGSFQNRLVGEARTSTSSNLKDTDAASLNANTSITGCGSGTDDDDMWDSDNVGSVNSEGFANLVWVRDDSSWKIYWNGQVLTMIDTGTQTLSGTDSDNDMLELGVFTHQSLFHKYGVRDVSIFNAELNDTQVAELYNSGNFFDVRTASTVGDLVFYCPLEEDGTELINGNDLTITGATFTSIG